MVSSHIKKSCVAYLKKQSDCKGEIVAWPIGEDTAAEFELKCSVSKGLTGEVVTAFQKLVYGYFAEYRRDLPWRAGHDPYRVLVSEVMLQQTQVERVLPRFTAFLDLFPDVITLASAPLPALLSAWQGLGYNRRALNLQRAAHMIAEEWGGSIPDDPLLLRKLPGIGPYTAGAIAAFAFNRPELFLETNIRSVLLHFFFGDRIDVADRELLPIAARVLDRQHPREWYNALMDYGSDLKRRFPNPSRRSRHHSVQGRFEGSDRQIRGAVLRRVLERHSTADSIQEELEVDADRLKRILDGMVQEGFLKKTGADYFIP